MPKSSARISRRSLVLTSAAMAATGGIEIGGPTGLAQTPDASPVAVPDVDQIARYAEMRDDLIARGRKLISALIDGDDGAFLAQFSPDVAGQVSGFSARKFMAALQTHRVSLSMPQLGLWIAAHFDGTETMDGFFYQAGSTALVLETENAQSGDVPMGTWRGTIGPGTIDLEIEVEFSGSIDRLEATLSVPSQGLSGFPFDIVTFAPMQPLGEALEEEGLPISPAANVYRISYQWGDGILVLNAEAANDGMWSAFQAQATLPLPPDPSAGVDPVGEYRLPANEQLLVVWGGDSEFRNYHAATPVQRHAVDLLVWREGGSCPEGMGLANEHYYIWGLPLVAPVAGTVVDVVNDSPDVLPALNPAYSASISAEPAHPAGNHVVIEVTDSEYVLIAHMQEGSVAVAVGDTVQPGDPIGLVGNSGNTSEPHIHIHVQDVADMFDPAANGLPLVFRDLRVDGEPVTEGAAAQGAFMQPA